MKNKLQQIIGDKRLLILGFGREGQSSYHLFRKYFPLRTLAIADENETLYDDLNQLNDVNLNIYLGNDCYKNLNKYDLILKTPGISFQKIKDWVSPDKISSQTDIFIKLFSEQMIGITGTKGKSTTCSLLYHILKLFSQNTVFVGNIGIPHFDLIESINPDTKIVCELSSHQLEFISKAPNVSVLLNLYQEHLDHYETLEDYHLAKLNMLKYQNEHDYFIYCPDELLVEKYVKLFNLKRNYLTYSLQSLVSNGCKFHGGHVVFTMKDTKKVFDINTNRQLKGDHNLLNIMAVINVCQILNILDDIILEGIRTFKGLEHRLEYVGCYNKIHFYNDSIATIPEATINALKSLDSVDTLILGGFDRGIDYTILVEFLYDSMVRNLIFLGDAGKRIANELKKTRYPLQKTFFVTSMVDAVKIAMDETRKGSVCLLSPAAASYDMFTNFAHRGEVYKNAIRSMG